MTTESIKTIAVIGAGTMGQGIAQLCASAGYQVMLYDVQAEQTKSAIDSIRKKLDALVTRGKVTSLHKDETLKRIQAVGDFRQPQVDMVIEAAMENLEIKQKIFLEVEELNGKECILTSNTSSISITQIASILKHQERFAGLHFFNPAPTIKLVEIVKGAATDDGTIDFLKSFSKSILKDYVLVADSPGFIVNRVARHFYTEALKIMEENVSDFKSIDELMKATGFKMGPFELIDLIGMDINHAVTSSLYQAFQHNPKFRPSLLQQQMIDANHLGKKSGRGFYNYTTSTN